MRIKSAAHAFLPVSIFFSILVSGAAVSRAAAVDDTLALGRKALRNEGVTMAWKLSQRALTEAPESASAHEFTGEVLFRRGDFAQAESEFKRAVKLDANFAPAWWGLARVARCTSRHKTAAEYLRRARELDPKDMRIFHDWAMALRGQQHLDAVEKYVSLLEPVRDADELRDLRQYIQLYKALNGRKIMVLASPYEKSVIPLAKVITYASHMRTYGLEISVNGNKLRLVLDTGAGGILIQRRAAERAGVVKLSDASFRGIGNAKRPGGYHAIAERVRIGDVEFRDALINVVDQDFTTEDGLIGTNVFSEFLVTLDFAAGQLHLNPLPSYHAGDEELQDGVIPPDMRSFTRVFQFGHMLLLPTRVSGSREVRFIIDTGSARTLISYDLAAEVSKLNRDDKLHLNGISGRVSDVYQTGDLFLEFAGFRQKSLGMTAFDLWDQSRNLGTEVSGLFGLPLLELFTLTIDYRDGLVNFYYQEQNRAPLPRSIAK
jgi:tetratricopeptide (TPR) repeat protein